jgi:RNA polymerase sigma-70 factor, ECF subfamily
MRPTLDDCPVEESDARIIDSCLNGDRQKYRLLVERHQAAVFGYLQGKHQGHGPDACDEIAQETFVRAFRRLNSLKKPESFLSWIIGIADRVCRETDRADWRRRRFLNRQRDEAQSRGAEAKSDHDVDPDVQRAVAHLPEPYRNIVLMRFYQGLSCNQMAEQLKLPLGTVTKTLSRAYQMLREELSPAAHPPRSAGERVQP